MRLLLDIGNSCVKWAMAAGTTLTDGGRIEHRSDPDWVAALPSARPAAVWVANVAGAEPLRSLMQQTRRRWGLSPQEAVATAAACGVRNAYPRPQRLGVDRWLACIGAHHHGSRGSALVVDAGTALTLDLVAADGQHRGGLISPGVTAMRRALHGGTQLRTRQDEFDLDWLADDTDPAVGLGTLHAALGLIEGARRALQPDRLLLTGGEAPLLARHLSGRYEHAPNLVLEGLARVAAEASGW